MTRRRGKSRERRSQAAPGAGPRGREKRSDTPAQGDPRVRKPLGERPPFQLAFLFVALLGVFLLRDFWVSVHTVDRIPYSEFAGLEKKNRILVPREREIVAHHEMGHALVAAAQPGTDPVHKVSIVARGIGALGYTLQRPTDDRYLMTRDELERKLAVLLGGRAAEELVFQKVSTGAADDLARATDIAHSMVSRYGMDEALGPVTYEREPVGWIGVPGAPSSQTRSYSEATAREIDCAVRALVTGALERARTILERNRPVLEESARALLAHETLGAAELRTWIEKVEPVA